MSINTMQFFFFSHVIYTSLSHTQYTMDFNTILTVLRNGNNDSDTLSMLKKLYQTHSYFVKWSPSRVIQVLDCFCSDSYKKDALQCAIRQYDESVIDDIPTITGEFCADTYKKDALKILIVKFHDSKIFTNQQIVNVLDDFCADTYKKDALALIVKRCFGSVDVKGMVWILDQFCADTYKIDALKILLPFAKNTDMDVGAVIEILNDFCADTYKIDALKVILGKLTNRSYFDKTDINEIVNNMCSNSYKHDAYKLFHTIKGVSTISINEAKEMNEELGNNDDGNTFTFNGMTMRSNGGGGYIMTTTTRNNGSTSTVIRNNGGGFSMVNGVVVNRNSSSSNETKMMIPDEWEDEPIVPEEVEGEELCVICYKRTPSTACVDCGHKAICVTCVRELIKRGDIHCPMCRKKVVKGFIRVYDV